MFLMMHVFRAYYTSIFSSQHVHTIAVVFGFKTLKQFDGNIQACDSVGVCGCWPHSGPAHTDELICLASGFLNSPNCKIRYLCYQP